MHWRTAGRLGSAPTLPTNSLSVAYDGNRLILNDLELRQQFPDAADYPSAPPRLSRQALQRGPHAGPELSSPVGSRFSSSSA